MSSSFDARLHQLNPVIGDIEGNKQKIIAALHDAERAGVDLLLLPELCVCGYPPMDLLEYPSFLHEIFETNEQIIDATQKTALIFGSVTKDESDSGPLYFNTALMAHHGHKIARVRKTLLPVNDVFDEERYFERNSTFSCVDWRGRKLGISICEDIWENRSTIQFQTYAVDPIQKLIEDGAELIVNISASPFTDMKSADRQQMLEERARNTGCPVFYVNQTGANTDLITDGDSMVLNGKGEIIARAPLFYEAHTDVNLSSTNEITAQTDQPIASMPSRIQRLFCALKVGLREYINKTAVTDGVLLGLSGGIDSSLVACIAAEALGKENVMGVAMPSDFSTKASVTDAEQLARNLDIDFHEMPIKNLYESYLELLKPLFKGTSFGVAEENLQSRARGMLLMAIANKFNRFVLNTGNKSELATGYCTLYGDMNGALAVISDLYKTEIYELADWLNEAYYEQEIIPSSIIKKAPSAELRPNQKDSDTLPDYNILDTVLKLYIEQQQSVGDIAARGFDSTMVEKVIKLVNRNEFKRFQAPPGLKLHHKAFGRGRRWPIVQQWK